MPDPTTGVSTDATSVVSSQQATTGNPLVNPAQSPTQAPPFAQQQQQDVSGLIASYENRIRNLMSEKDKALNERNQAIAQLSDLQKQYTDEKAQTHQSLTNTATAAQTAIDQSRIYEAEIAQLKGQLLRSNTLLSKPHLAPYADFIHPTSDATEMQQLVAKLEEIRNDDLKRSGVVPFLQPSQQQQQGQPQYQQQGALNQTYLPQGTSSPLTTTPGMASGLPNQMQQAGVDPMSLYANRQTLAPGLIPGSSPAQMHPAGAGNVTQSIQQMLADALRSGNPGEYERVLQQATAIANSAVSSQLGR